MDDLLEENQFEKKKDGNEKALPLLTKRPLTPMPVAKQQDETIEAQRDPRLTFRQNSNYVFSLVKLLVGGVGLIVPQIIFQPINDFLHVFRRQIARERFWQSKFFNKVPIDFFIQCILIASPALLEDEIGEKEGAKENQDGNDDIHITSQVVLIEREMKNPSIELSQKKDFAGE